MKYFVLALSIMALAMGQTRLAEQQTTSSNLQIHPPNAAQPQFVVSLLPPGTTTATVLYVQADPNLFNLTPGDSPNQLVLTLKNPPTFNVFTIPLPTVAQLPTGPVPIRAGFGNMSFSYAGAPFITVDGSQVQPAAPCYWPGATVPTPNPTYLCVPGDATTGWQWARVVFLTW